MTPFDLVLLILIANAVQNAMTGGDNSVSGGIVAAGTLLLLNSLVSRLVQRHKGIRRFVEGTPTILIRHGKIIGENLDKEHMNVDELLQALREHGVAGVEDVFSAILEIDGSISVIKREDSPKVEKAIHRFRFIKRK